MFSWIRTLVAPRALLESHSALDFDPAWHGDHWQNLLSSPMDARHYVMEDWAISSPLTFESEATESPETAKEAEAILDEEMGAAN
ncbi:hypothetical protein M0D69_01350 [Caballeronia sp. SEWSISQ10-4 2]|uniref:hypothetical protein n=1 Tax=Caballeronia sp. SEWSISQ10-4 2 TaxID=2937438 RepID=UPI0026568DF6|nr:hypothetical protein [Caballeronia sp. SEWSISQ10-4 2]MDN7176688.1 hypothetical protein [Caballeronia sp. SEWSISQ10-4 2]